MTTFINNYNQTMKAANDLYKIKDYIMLTSDHAAANLFQQVLRHIRIYGDLKIDLLTEVQINLAAIDQNLNSCESSDAIEICDANDKLVMAIISFLQQYVSSYSELLEYINQVHQQLKQPQKNLLFELARGLFNTMKSVTEPFYLGPSSSSNSSSDTETFMELDKITNIISAQLQQSVVDMKDPIKLRNIQDQLDEMMKIVLVHNDY